MSAARSGGEQGAAVLAAVLERLPLRHPTLAVLTYHRVAPAAERPDLHPGLRVDPETFAAQLAVLGAAPGPLPTSEGFREATARFRR